MLSREPQDSKAPSIPLLKIEEKGKEKMERRDLI
jgi:hypothetical protein